MIYEPQDKYSHSGRNSAVTAIGDCRAMIKTKIHLLAGFDSAVHVPKYVKSASLKYRLAVIQETYRADKVDMYFDEALWRRLLEFALPYSPGLHVGIIAQRSKKEMQPGGFLATWNAWADEDRYPPEFILLRGKENLVLCIATEYWTHVGGPRPYSNSYTYSIYSNEDLSARVMRFLLEAEASQGWDISPDVLRPERNTFWKTWLGRLFPVGLYVAAGVLWMVFLRQSTAGKLSFSAPESIFSVLILMGIVVFAIFGLAALRSFIRSTSRIWRKRR